MTTGTEHITQRPDCSNPDESVQLFKTVFSGEATFGLDSSLVHLAQTLKRTKKNSTECYSEILETIGKASRECKCVLLKSCNINL